jgi:hypothetical protein
MGDLVEKQAPAARLVSPGGREGTCEAGACVDYVYLHPPWRKPELDAQIALASDFAAADCVGDELGDEQEDVLADRGGPRPVGCQHRLACRRSGFMPPVECEGTSCPRVDGVRAGEV